MKERVNNLISSKTLVRLQAAINLHADFKKIYLFVFNLFYIKLFVLILSEGNQGITHIWLSVGVAYVCVMMTMIMWQGIMSWQW